MAKTDGFAQAVHICMHSEVLNITFIKSPPESKSGGDQAHHNIKSPIGNKIWGWKAQLQKSLSTALLLGSIYNMCHSQIYTMEIYD